MQLTLEHRSSGTVVSTIDLQSDGCRVLGYVPETSEKETVSETCDLLIEKSSADNLHAKTRAIEAMVAFARKHQNGPEGIWVLYSPNTTTSYQSRLVNGAVLHDGEINFLWEKYKAKIGIVFERLAYWETEEAVTLQLSNGSVTDQNAAPIDNCQDASHDLYVEIDGDQVTGVLPTPAIIEFTNIKNDANLVDHLAVGLFAGDGVNTPPTPGSLVCESDGNVDATCSGGEYDDLSWADDAENQLTSWTIASGDFAQKRYRAVVRLRDAVAYTDLWLKAKLLSGAVVIAETRWMLVNASEELVVIGSLMIPPFALGEALDLGNLTLALYEKRATGAGILNLDYLILLPQDGWRRYSAISGLAYNEKLIDDPVRGVLVTQYGAGSYKVTHKIKEGLPVMLQPGVKNILFFLQDITTGEADIDRTASVTVKCHPRRLTV
jgi:hypothetical protein